MLEADGHEHRDGSTACADAARRPVLTAVQPGRPAAAPTHSSRHLLACSEGQWCTADSHARARGRSRSSRGTEPVAHAVLIGSCIRARTTPDLSWLLRAGSALHDGIRERARARGRDRVRPERRHARRRACCCCQWPRRVAATQRLFSGADRHASTPTAAVITPNS